MFFFGYMIAVPILSSMTDRIDARRVYMGSCALSGVSALGFGFFAGGVVSAARFRPWPEPASPAPTCPVSRR